MHDIEVLGSQSDLKTVPQITQVSLHASLSALQIDHKVFIF